MTSKFGAVYHIEEWLNSATSGSAQPSVSFPQRTFSAAFQIASEAVRLKQMYSERLRELFQARAHAGKLDTATHYGEAGTPGHGPYIQLWLRVVDGVVEQARFKTYGCPAAIACAEAVAAWSEGQLMCELAVITPERVADWVGGVPDGKEHCTELAAKLPHYIFKLR